MHRVFGRKAAAPAAPKGPSLTEVATEQEQKNSEIAAKIHECGETARRNMLEARSGNVTAKRRAMQALKQKKLYEQQLGRTENMQFNVQQMAFAQENAEMQKQTVAAMRVGMHAMQQIHGGLDIDAVADLHDDMAGLMAEQNEMDDMFSDNMMGAEGMDDDALLAEMEGMEEMIALEQFDPSPVVPSGVPTIAAAPVAAEPAVDAVAAVAANAPATELGR